MTLVQKKIHGVFREKCSLESNHHNPIIQTVVNLLSTASWRGVWNLLDDAVTQVFIKIITILRIEIIIILTMTSIIIIIINLILRERCKKKN